MAINWMAHPAKSPGAAQQEIGAAPSRLHDFKNKRRNGFPSRL
jgi:hypothetical protein